MPALVFATAGVTTVEFIVVGLLPDLARDLGIALDEAAWQISAFAVSAALLGPPATLLAGRWPAHLVLAACLAIFGVGTLAAAFYPEPGVMIALRLLQGALLTVFVSLASAEAAARAGPRRGGRAVGQVNLGLVIGTVFVVPLGVALADLIGWRAVYGGLGGLILLAAGLVLGCLPERAEGPARPRPGQGRILFDPRFLAQLLLSALLFTAMFAAYSYIAAYLEVVLRLSGAELAAALLGFGLAGLAGNWLAMRHVDRDPLRLTFAVALVLVAATAALPLAGGEVVLAILPLAAWGAAHTAAFVACQVRVMFAAPAAPAFAAALNISVCNLGIAAGALLGGWIVSRFGAEAIWLGAVVLGSLALALSPLLPMTAAEQA